MYEKLFDNSKVKKDPTNNAVPHRLIQQLTGKGMLQKKFQELFLLKASELYKPFIDEYNDLLIMLKIKEQLSEYINSLDNSISENKRMQFAKDAERELSPIVCEKYL